MAWSLVAGAIDIEVLRTSPTFCEVTLKTITPSSLPPGGRARLFERLVEAAQSYFDLTHRMLALRQPALSFEQRQIQIPDLT